VTPWSAILLLLAVAFLISLIQIGAISIAFEKLGLSPRAGLLLIFGSLLGSTINLPLYRRETPRRRFDPADLFESRRRTPGPVSAGGTLIAANVGGCIIPVAVSLYLLVHHSLSPLTTALGIAAVALISYRFSRLIPGVGIGMPLLLAPLVSALLALLLAPGQSAPLAYISGTLGVLVGADLLHLRDLQDARIRVASIGGAGTFDGIFITGIVAALLA
jgi:uncharacterized membrane protein